MKEKSNSEASAYIPPASLDDNWKSWSYSELRQLDKEAPYKEKGKDFVFPECAI
jgi:hypothetical protein